MKLKEFESRRLLNRVGISTPESIVFDKVEDIPEFNHEKLIKVQTLAGSRGKAGGIIKVKNKQETIICAEKFLGKQFLNEKISELLLDEKIEINQEFKQEYYLGIMFDTSRKCPIILFSENGGINIEEQNEIKRLEIDYINGIEELDKLTDNKEIQEILKRLYQAFVRFDCKMIEINPLVKSIDNKFIAVDAVAVLDDDAKWRREIEFPERTDTRDATMREISAREIDEDDHRGVAGKTFIDLDGDIAILTSGGGASMTLMDAMIESNGKPANFTEYSGNPSKEKVEKLTRIVLQKENLSGLLIAGSIANFTNIAETLSGVATVLKEIKPKYPIVIRRAGPNDQEARIMLERIGKEYGLNVHYYDEKTPLTKAVEIIIKLSEEFKRGNIN
jgi:citryl-CoA synthetase large subunit